MDLAYVMKLAKEKNGVKYLLNRQDLFDKMLDAKCMKGKDSKENVRTVLAMITKKNRSKKIWVGKGTELSGQLRRLCKAEAMHFHSTLCETKTAFVERTIQASKKYQDRHMEDFGHKCIHKMSQFIRTHKHQKKLLHRLDTKKHQEFRPLVHPLQPATTKK